MPATIERKKGVVPTMEQAAADYLSRHTDWAAEDYRLENSGLTDDRRHIILWAIHRDDETRPRNRHGGCKSVSLHVDPKTHQVVKMLHFQ